MRMKNLCLGAHPGSLNKNLVARTRNLGAPGDRAPVRQQPWDFFPEMLTRRINRGKVLYLHVGWLPMDNTPVQRNGLKLLLQREK